MGLAVVLRAEAPPFLSSTYTAPRWPLKHLQERCSHLGKPGSWDVGVPSSDTLNWDILKGSR